jgi:hypothetical protein
MGLIRAEGHSVIDAPAKTVYTILSDYHAGHPRILPGKYFGELVVEKGGTGAGTVIRFSMKSFGTSRLIRAEISEPEPGRVLAETDLASGAVTTFTVEPTGDGSGSSVVIRTQWEGKGLAGMIEGLLAPALLRRVYREELANLAQLAQARRMS